MQENLIYNIHNFKPQCLKTDKFNNRYNYVEYAVHKNVIVKIFFCRFTFLATEALTCANSS